jgi:hypothetical protein
MSLQEPEEVVRPTQRAVETELGCAQGRFGDVRIVHAE